MSSNPPFNIGDEVLPLFHNYTRGKKYYVLAMEPNPKCDSGWQVQVTDMDPIDAACFSKITITRHTPVRPDTTHEGDKVGYKGHVDYEGMPVIKGFFPTGIPIPILNLNDLQPGDEVFVRGLTNGWYKGIVDQERMTIEVPSRDDPKKIALYCTIKYSEIKKQWVCNGYIDASCIDTLMGCKF